ncbi:LysE/ArgO family amino acid transporter [Hyalangium sp.]|uniref:LysE/ArgO family amino acid transporter n=1 Tax=Hyalangium sp. TaxID=2028555 RepID=UPI002D3F11D2|nr:LysE/ArgO family amino acid transporter [Hyalangium sp.]HYH96909.1 LysE/ArgO family amino acid transporter [Hyalangium sp.]
MLSTYMSAALKGFGLGTSLIVAIGAQNAFVLRQGLKREHVFVVATICFLCDATLIALGSAGFGSLVAAFPRLTDIAAWCGAAFLLAYGLRSFRAAIRPSVLKTSGGEAGGMTLKQAVLTTLALSLLNPHVYLDTVILLGSLAGQYVMPPRAFFALGAMAASCVWFYGVGYGAGRLAPLFSRPTSWRVLDLLIGIIMWSIAFSLLRPYVLGS